MISVIIPAHNEAAVIGRCLAPLTSGPAAGKLEIVVVANGCTDDTAARAETYPGVHVIDTSVPGKGHALNLGDSHATGFPRFYVDADIELSYDAIRAVGRVLERGDALVAAPASRSTWPGGRGGSGPTTTSGPGSPTCATGTSDRACTRSARPGGNGSTSSPR
jgi:glycosyltransferase involved in cell wall biosynthesis